MAELPYTLVDVFTDRALSGNALAVFTDARGLTQPQMQALARELNLSETTFVLPPEQGGSARVRIFTPRSEIPFAGHPTLGTAIVLGTDAPTQALVLELSVGAVPVVLERESGKPLSGWFTRPVPRPVAFAETAALLSALGVTNPATPALVYNNGMLHAIVHLRDTTELDELRPDLNRLAQLPVDTIDVFAFDGTTAHLRVFAPAHGIVEDPATGSAAAPVFCHLVEYAGLDPRATLTIRQGDHLQRAARLLVRQAQANSQQIEVGGSGVIVARGEFTLS